MNDSVNEFLTTFPIDNPLLWALLVMVVVAATSVAFFIVWEVLLGLRVPFGSSKNNRQSGQC